MAIISDGDVATGIISVGVTGIGTTAGDGIIGTITDGAIITVATDITITVAGGDYRLKGRRLAARFLRGKRLPRLIIIIGPSAS